MLKNRTKSVTISGDCEFADSLWKRGRGLMFRRRLERPVIFIFPFLSRVDSAIHSFFVFFPFDAVFLDERKRVVDVRHGIRPFTPFVMPAEKAKYLVEMPAGLARKKKIEVGDALSF